MDRRIAGRCARAIVIATCALGVATPLAAQGTPPAVRKSTPYEDLQMFGQVLNQIRVNHPDSVDTHELMMAAIEGMVSAADPHSFVIPAVRLQPGKEEQLRAGKLVPVPVNFAFVDGAPIVASVSAGSAASHLDILPGDELVSMDGRSMDAASAEELEIALAGPKGSEIKLGFERRRIDGSLVVLERAVRRERVDEATAIPAALMLDSATGYVRVTTFMGDKVADDLHAALDRLEKTGMTQLVLDLRDNGGGSVSEAARVAGEFLPKGAIVYTSEGSKPELTDTGRVSRSFWGSQQQRKYPIVMLINAGTASASELVAGALQDHDRALIMGRPSFGKSLLMQTFPLRDGSEIVLVVGRVRTPCGRVVQREYRNITRHEYYRLARMDRDTAGRPACKTDAGRTVYGGGGIFPDVLVDAQPGAPLWYSRASEQLLPITWAGGYATAAAATLGSLDAFVRAPVLPPAAASDFRKYAKSQGVDIPTDTATDVTLQRLLARAVANAKWGGAGLYSVTAVLDAEVSAAKQHFPQAEALVKKP
ncbi:MAG: S41 family peptidase [Gemmatimonadaceae bacterium]